MKVSIEEFRANYNRKFFTIL